MYDGRDYPDKLMITIGIKERLEGREEAEKCLMAHIDVPGLRIIAVENAFAVKHYPLEEMLCRKALKNNIRGYFNK